MTAVAVTPDIERLETARLVLERMRPEHEPELARLLGDPRVGVTLGGTRTRAEAAEILAAHVAHWGRHGYGLWIMRDRVTGAFVGRGGLNHARVGGRDELEIGWAVVPERQGEGLATELAHRTVEVAFGVLGRPDVVSFTLPHNAASRRVMEKAGLVFEAAVLYRGWDHVLYRRRADPPLSEPFRWDREQIAVDLPHAGGRFTTRRGGVSREPFGTLNLGRLTDDDPDAVDVNRARVARHAGIPWERVCFGRQVHGTRVRRATEPPGPARRVADEDGQATALPDAACAVFVADCVPVLLAAEGAVAAVHGGWRGLAGGILAEGVAALRDVGGRGPIQAAIGPSARGCCYEVGEEVHAALAAHGARRGERNLALEVVVRDQLRAAGVGEIHDTGLCTLCADPALLFSHRRDGGRTGRQAGLVWRDGAPGAHAPWEAPAADGGWDGPR
jgi:YfiH family protein